MKINTLQILSVLGILGALILFTGDMFFYFVPVDGSTFSKGNVIIMSQRHNIWLVIGALVGPIAGLLLSAASLSIYFALKSYSKFLSILIALSFIIIFTFGGVYQTIYPMQGFYYRIADAQIKADVFYYLGLLMHPINSILFIFGGVGSVLLILLVLFKKTIYPKWFIFFTPLSALLIGYLHTIIPYPLGAVIIGGWTNICLMMFFAINTSVLRKYDNINLGMLK